MQQGFDWTSGTTGGFRCGRIKYEMQIWSPEQIIAMVFTIGLLVFVHELGHFYMAKKTGVRVLTFSLGFGKKLLRKKWGGTEYVISAVPLGGYVKMAGENPDEKSTGAPWEFVNKPFRVKALIILAGPAMNLILALFLFWVIYLVGGVEVYQPIIGQVTPDSPAEQAGLMPMDRILSIGGKDIESWQDISPIVNAARDRETLAIEVAREKDVRSVDLRAEYNEEYRSYLIGIAPFFPPSVGKVVKDGPAFAAGLQDGDSLTVVGGEAVRSWEEAVSILSARAEQPVTIAWIRDGREMQGPITPSGAKFFSPDENGNLLGQPGFTHKSIYKSVGPVHASILAFKKMIVATKLLLTPFRMMARGEMERDSLVGPIGIFYFIRFIIDN